MFSSSRALANANTNISTDPYFPYVVLLLHGDGTNGAQNISYADNSPWATPVYYNGPLSSAVGSFSPYNPQGYFISFGGNTTNYSADYITIPYTSNFDWWTGNFTIEAWVWPFTLTGWFDSGTTTRPIMIGNMSATANNHYWSFGVNTSGQVAFYYNGNAVNSTATVTVGTWNHIAMTCDGTNIYLFCNGVGTAGTAISGTPSSSTSYTLTIGSYNNVSVTTNYIKGFVKDLRIVKGTAVYSGLTYTKPANPLTAITNTTLLLNQNNYTDSSVLDNTITPVNYPAILPGGPYANQPTYSPSYHIGSAYVSSQTSGNYWLRGGGSSAFLTANSWLIIGGDDFTIECWVYSPANIQVGAFGTTFTSISALFGLTQANTGTRNLTIGYTSGGSTVYASSGTTQMDTYSGLRNYYAYCWNHFAYSRVSGWARGYLNGRIQTDGLDNTPYNSAGWQLSGLTTYSAAYYVYFSDFKITKGIGYYTTQSFTPPATPVKLDQPAIYTNDIWCTTTFSSTNYLSWTNSNTTSLSVFNKFCVEFWINPIGLSASIQTVVGYTGINNLSFGMSTTQFQLSNVGYYSITGNWPFTLNSQTGTFYHIAIMGDAYNYVAINGIVVNTAAQGGSTAGGAAGGTWNFQNVVGYGMNAYIRDFRINIGTTVYGVSSNFSRPTLPLTVLPTTQILTLNGATLKDSSGNSTGLTNNGSFTTNLGLTSGSGNVPNYYSFSAATRTSLQFNNAGIYDSTGKNLISCVGTNGFSTAGTTSPIVSTTQSKFGGGSIYFGGSANYALRIPNQPIWDFGVSDWMIDFWIYLTTISTAQTIFSKKTTAAGFGPVQINVNASNQVTLNCSVNGTTYQTSTVTGVTLVANTWYYVACFRSGSTAYASVNGTIGNQIVLSTSALISNLADPVIGSTSYATGTQPVYGYIDDFRVTLHARGYGAGNAPSAPAAAAPNQ